MEKKKKKKKKGSTKAYGIKVRCYLGSLLRNMSGTWGCNFSLFLSGFEVRLLCFHEPLLDHNALWLLQNSPLWWYIHIYIAWSTLLLLQFFWFSPTWSWFDDALSIEDEGTWERRGEFMTLKWQKIHMLCNNFKHMNFRMSLSPETEIWKMNIDPPCVSINPHARQTLNPSRFG
jgi:hypothetical protein